MPLLACPYLGNETIHPMIPADTAQVRITRQQVLVTVSIMPAVNAVTPQNLVGEMSFITL